MTKWLRIFTFLRFLKSQKHGFLRSFEMLHTFSRTLWQMAVKMVTCVGCCSYSSCCCCRSCWDDTLQNSL